MNPVPIGGSHDIGLGDLPAEQVGRGLRDLHGPGETLRLQPSNPFRIPELAPQALRQGLPSGLHAGLPRIPHVGQVGLGLRAGRVAHGHRHAAEVFEVVIECQSAHHVGGAAERDGVGMAELLAVGVRGRLAPRVALGIHRPRAGDVSLGQSGGRGVIPAALDGGDETRPITSSRVAEHASGGQHPGVRRCQARSLETPFGLGGVLGNVVVAIRRARG